MKKKQKTETDQAPPEGAQPQDTPACNAEAQAAAAAAADPDPATAQQLDTDTSRDTDTAPAERLLRLQADFDNYRKRMARDHAALTERATEDLITELLPVMDNFDIALRHAGEDPACQAVEEGFRLVAEQLEAVLRKFGLESVPAEKTAFDPHQHEAVAHVPDAECPEGMIMLQTRRGYRLGSKLLRAAQVVVSSGAPLEQEPDRISGETQED